ncbi:uncharacterized protein [Populus alba]|uniref:uncharacterized protein n=1 Tax=Populus alba TaxID=43335 RepID=UPI003CC72902
MKFSKNVDYDKLTALEERLKAVEGADLYDPVYAAEMCLVPNVVVPKEFRVPEFIKYTGTECPVTHLKSYYNKMTEVVNDEKLLIHFFQDSLSGLALSWYTKLDNTKIRKWKDLVKAFMEQHKFNMEVAPDRSSLLVMEKGNKEIHFYDVVTIVERIEQAIRMGRMSKPTEKKGFTGKKKDPDVNNVEGGYKEMYSKLLSIGQVTPVPLTPLQPPYPNWYKPDLKCEYHVVVDGHNIESCNAFKNKLLQLIKARWITFDDAPNVKSNPLPNHAASSGGVNVVGVEVMNGNNYCKFHGKVGHHINDCEEFHQEVKRMLTFGMIRIGSEEESSEVGMIGCQETKTEVCRLQPTVGGPPKLILTKPVCINSGSYGTMPYNYGYSFNIKNPTPIFHPKIGGLTRSGGCFTPEELERQRKAKGKDIVDAFKGMEVNKPISEDESNEFLKLMKHSEYSVVDQLKKTPARISLMSLILSSELHRKALQKVLNEAYVPQDITQDTMEHLVGRIQASNYLYFTEDELDPEGTGHNKPLYITLKCKDCLISKVLVDNGSTLNVLPRHMLDEMPIDATYMRPSTMTARAYDRRPWIHAARAVTSSLHQCLKYIINGTLVKVKAEETLSMIRNVLVPYIEAEDCKDGNLHAFEIVNTKWNDPIAGNFKRVNIMKIKATDQRFGLGFKPKKDDHQRVARIK